jgi:cyclophilin family peptidyl-prolyl cis-trans isomerase/HEAT repeat protein
MSGQLISNRLMSGHSWLFARNSLLVFLLLAVGLGSAAAGSSREGHDGMGGSQEPARRDAMAAPMSSIDLPLGLPDNLDAAAVLLGAEDRRDLSEELLALTGFEDPTVRARAALAVGRVVLPAGMGRLLEMCSDPDARVRALAAFGVGLIELDIVVLKDEAAVLRRGATQVLLGLLDDSSPEVVAQAIWALGKLADESALAALSDLLGRAEATPPPRVAAALLAWWRLPGASSGPPIELLTFPDVDVRLAAAHALRRLDDPNARPALVQLLDDPSSLVRAMALRGLRYAPGSVADVQAIRMLADADWRVVAEALVWLEVAWGQDWQPDDASVYAVIRASMEHNVHLRRLALGVLGHVISDWPVAEDVLEQALRDPEAVVRAACLEAYAGAGMDAARGALAGVRDVYRGESRVVDGPEDGAEPALEDLRPVESIALVRFLAAAGNEESREWLELLGTEGSLAARIEVLQHWREMDAQWLATHVLEMLSSSDPLLQGVAADVVPSLVAAGQPVPGEDVEIGWDEILWQAHLDLQESGFVGSYLQVLGAIQDVNPEMFESRASIFYGSESRVVRLWTFRRLEGHVGAGERRRPLPAALAVEVTGPQETGRSDVEYRAMASELLRLQDERPRLLVQLRRGEFELELQPALAPLTTLAYLELAREEFFDGVAFHRVVPGFVAQVGDPTSTGHGGAPITLRNEETPSRYTAGTVGLALSGRDTGSSQFFIAHSPQPHLEGIYPVFGRVVRGQRTVERAQVGDAILVSDIHE